MTGSQGDPHFEGTQFILGEQEDETVYDAKFLISVLLVYVAKGDGKIDPSETDRMLDIVSSHFDSTNAEAMGLLTEAIRTFADNDNLIDRLRDISKSLSHPESVQIFDMLLEVIIADGELADGELRTVEFAGKLLGLTQDEIHEGIRSVR